MRIGIIGAMTEEISLLKNRLQLNKEEQYQNKTYYTGILLGKNIVLTQCGIGKVNAALVTQTLISKYSVDIVINLGLAGALAEDLNIGNIVVSSDLVYHDVDATGFGYDLGQIPGDTPTFFSSDEKLVNIASQNAEVFVGRIATGDQFVGDILQKEKIRENFNALCVEMEGAAIAHTCHLNNIPFVVIRSISDRASGGAFEEFKQNITIAVENSTKIVEDIIKIYQK